MGTPNPDYRNIYLFNQANFREIVHIPFHNEVRFTKKFEIIDLFLMKGSLNFSFIIQGAAIGR